MENIYQPEIEVTDPKILKKQKKFFSLGLSGLIIAICGGGVGVIMQSVAADFCEWLLKKGITSDLISFFTASMMFIGPSILSVVLGTIGIAKGKKLKKVGQLKEKSAIGYVFAHISICWGVTILFLFILMIAAFIFSFSKP